MMTIGKARRTAYRTARVLGDVQAVRRGRVGQRVVNRAIGRTVARSLWSIWR